MNEEFQNSVYPGQPRNVTIFKDRRAQTESEVLASLIEKLMERIDRLDEKLTAHAEMEPETIRRVLEETMAKSFPEGDPDGHRRHHESLIKQAEERAKFWGEMRLAVAKWAGLGLLAFLAVAGWHELLKGPK